MFYKALICSVIKHSLKHTHTQICIPSNNYAIHISINIIQEKDLANYEYDYEIQKISMKHLRIHFLVNDQ